MDFLKNHERVAGVVIVAGAAFLFYEAGNYPPDTALFPRVLLAAAILIGGWIILRSIILKEWREKEFEPFFTHIPRLLIGVIGMGAFLVGVANLGYYTSTAIFIPALAWLLGYRNKIVILIATIFYLGVTILVFDILFNLKFPKEIFMPY